MITNTNNGFAIIRNILSCMNKIIMAKKDETKKQKKQKVMTIACQRSGSRSFKNIAIGSFWVIMSLLLIWIFFLGGAGIVLSDLFSSLGEGIGGALGDLFPSP